MFSKYDEESKKVLLNMRKEMTLLKHPYIGTEHLFLSILKYGSDEVINKFKSEGIIYGICVKMFTIAGPVIVFGTVSSVLVGFIYWIIGMF